MGTSGKQSKGTQSKVKQTQPQPSVNAGSTPVDDECLTFRNSRREADVAEQAHSDDMQSCTNHRLRNIRAEVQEVIRILDEYLAGNVDIRLHYSDLDSAKEDVDEEIGIIKSNYLSHIPPNDNYSRIFNLWQIATDSPIFNKSKRGKFFKNAKDQNRLREINIQRNRFLRMQFLIEYSTANERINNWIKVARPGYALPFHTIFEDEMSSQEDQQRIMNLYALKPEAIKGGLLDPVKGIILCYPTKSWDRFWRHIMIVLFFLLTFVLVLDAGYMLILDNQIQDVLKFSVKEINPPLIVLCWTLMLFGIAGHILVTGAKKANVENRQFPLPLRDWDYYLSARTTMILYKITLSLFVFASMFVLLEGKLKPMDAFLIGYSLDSVVELLGASLEKRSAGNINAIKGKL